MQKFKEFIQYVKDNVKPMLIGSAIVGGFVLIVYYTYKLIKK